MIVCNDNHADPLQVNYKYVKTFASCLAVSARRREATKVVRAAAVVAIRRSLLGLARANNAIHQGLHWPPVKSSALIEDIVTRRLKSSSSSSLSLE